MSCVITDCVILRLVATPEMSLMLPGSAENDGHKNEGHDIDGPNNET